jgi:hypothetical protein
LKTNDIDWISCLRFPAIKQLADDTSLQMERLDESDFFAVTSPEAPEELFVASRNPFLGVRRARVRNELLDAAEKKLIEIQEATRRAHHPPRQSRPRKLAGR